jgi:hypothetical protein
VLGKFAQFEILLKGLNMPCLNMPCVMITRQRVSDASFDMDVIIEGSETLR